MSAEPSIPDDAPRVDGALPLDFERAGGGTLRLLAAKVAGGLPVGTVVLLDAHGNPEGGRVDVVFDDGEVEYRARKALNFHPALMSEIERALRAVLRLRRQSAPAHIPAPFTCDLPGGYRLTLKDARLEDAAAIGHAFLFDGAGAAVFDKPYVTLNGDGRSLADLVTDITQECPAAAAFAPQIVEALADWGVALERGETPAATAQPSRIVRAGDIALTEPRALIAETLPSDCLAVLVGKESSYKSFTALSMAAAILTGADWCGRPVEQGAVLYLAAEGQSGIRRRLRAWEIVNKLSLDDLLILPVAVNLLDPAEVDRLEAEIAALDPQPVLIVVDTLNRNMRGDENSTADMSAFIAACDRLRRLAGACVLVLHHENKSGEYRGSSVLVASADCEISAKANGATVTLSAAKMKDGAKFDPIRLSAHVVELGFTDRHGKPVTSVVLRPTPDHATDAAQPLSATQATALRALREADKPLTAKEWLLLAGLPKSTFFSVRGELDERGLLAVAGRGKGAQYTAVGPRSVPDRSHETYPMPLLVPPVRPSPPIGGGTDGTNDGTDERTNEQATFPSDAETNRGTDREDDDDLF